jgi:hypothetical protein
MCIGIGVLVAACGSDEPNAGRDASRDVVEAVERTLSARSFEATISDVSPFGEAGTRIVYMQPDRLQLFPPGSKLPATVTIGKTAYPREPDGTYSALTFPTTSAENFLRLIRDLGDATRIARVDEGKYEVELARADGSGFSGTLVIKAGLVRRFVITNSRGDSIAFELSGFGDTVVIEAPADTRK